MMLHLLSLRAGYESLEGGHAFDPEGLVSSLTAVVASIFGAHCGAVTVLVPGHWGRLRHWGVFGGAISVAGLVLHFAGLPLNTDLYSLSYLLLSTGVSMLALCLCYYMVDCLPSLQAASLDLSPASRRDVTPLLRPFHW
jgi:predicted acyltransferase